MRKGGGVFFQLAAKGFNIFAGSLDMQQNTACGIRHLTLKLMRFCQLIHKGSESNPLDNPVDIDFFGFRCQPRAILPLLSFQQRLRLP